MKVSTPDGGFAFDNPDYGNGVYRRRIRLVNSAGQVRAELEDTTHAFRLTLVHALARVTDVVAEPIRYPFNTCPGAVDQLQPLLGCHIGAAAGESRRRLDPGQNCTHLYDLALLALAHARRDDRERVYDITVPDEKGSTSRISVARDGIVIHAWQVDSHCVASPREFAGQPLKKGFYHWASAAFCGDRLEAAQVLQRGYFVAQSRRQDYMNAGGRPATADRMPDGACYSYNTGVVERAVHTAGMGRDFSNRQDDLLRFI
ncbi:DUF2889 domain-containing protein [Seongchinamella sediminis]|uniref:DUF2889 domain-containing protein n=1 Tax=Seongchinamella sediminis TaxID=2283635 RepID=UPI0013C339D7|nr:DUF2889 domain-containing protein [Seongchinamella sediminis]